MFVWVERGESIWAKQWVIDPTSPTQKLFPSVCLFFYNQFNNHIKIIKYFSLFIMTILNKLNSKKISFCVLISFLIDQFGLHYAAQAFRWTNLGVPKWPANKYMPSPTRPFNTPVLMLTVKYWANLHAIFLRINMHNHLLVLFLQLSLIYVWSIIF